MKKLITIMLTLAIIASANSCIYAGTISINVPAEFKLSSNTDIQKISGYSMTVDSYDHVCAAMGIETDYKLVGDNGIGSISFSLFDINNDSQITEDVDFIFAQDEGGVAAGEYSNILGIKLDADELSAAKAGTYRATLKFSDKSETCVLEGADVMLADGSTKKIEDVCAGDVLRTYDFFTGKISSRAVLYNVPEKAVLANVVHVTLDNGSVLDICDCQSFFDMDELTFFDVSAETAKSCVGKNIMYINGDNITTAKITDITSENKICNSYEIFTEYDMNFVANGFLTLEPGVWLEGMYTVGSDLKIDMEQYQADIAEYGQYEYKDFEKYFSEDTFNKVRVADKKIAVGKGTITEEELFAAADEWVPICKQYAEQSSPKLTMLTASLGGMLGATPESEDEYTTEIILVVADKGSKSAVDTSDSSNIALYSIMALLALAGIGIAGYKKRADR